MRSRACRSFRSSSASRATTRRRPIALEEGDLERLRAEDRFRRSQPSRRLHRGRGREDRRPRVRGHGARRVDDLQPRHHGHHDSRRRLRGPPAGAGGARRQRPLRADGRRPRWVPGSAQGDRKALRPDPVGDRLDDARAHDPSRRLLGARARRSEHVPPALDLRPRTETSTRSRGRSTSRPGIGRRTASERHGATRSRTRSSRPPRARSSARSRAS